MKSGRRQLLRDIGICSAGLLLHGFAGEREALPKEPRKKEIEVTGLEDLMREHGVLRRALLVYGETLPKLPGDSSLLLPDMLQRTARLFRAFGEDYHEKKLEEAHIFPALKKRGGAVSALTDILIEQHQRGREITDYILSVAQGGRLDSAAIPSFEKTVQSFVLMYQNHTAREDTVVFPAWKKTLTAKAYEETGERFEKIEHQQFGEDGFEKALREMTEIERALGLSDIRQFTAPPPPPR
jgi:hemerythrin-like domain-containing protein